MPITHEHDEVEDFESCVEYGTFDEYEAFGLSSDSSITDYPEYEIFIVADPYGY